MRKMEEGGGVACGIGGSCWTWNWELWLWIPICFDPVYSDLNDTSQYVRYSLSWREVIEGICSLINRLLNPVLQNWGGADL